MHHTLAALLKRNSPTFTRSQREIADSLLTRPWDAAPMTMVEIAETTGASRSGIVRFAKGCGFDGCRDLRAECQRQLRTTLFPAERIPGHVAGLRRGKDLTEGVLATGRSPLGARAAGRPAPQGRGGRRLKLR